MIVAAVLLGVATSAFAKRTTGADMAVVKTNESVFKVFYQAAEKSTVQVRIANAAGEIIFKESIKNIDGFVRPYNLSQLPKGSYSLTVDNGKNIRTELIENHQPVTQKAIHFELLDNRQKVAITAYASREVGWVIKVLDDQHREIYKALHKVNGQFGKIFRIKNAVSYTIEVHDENGMLKSFTH